MKRVLPFLIVLFLFSTAFADQETGQSVFQFLKGYQSARAGRYDEAIECYRIALAADPTSAIIRNELALLYVKKNQLDRAEALLLQSVKAKPDDRQSLLLLAGLYSSKNAFDKARALYLRCIELNKEDTEAYLLLGAIQVTEKKLQEALRSYETVLSYDDENTMALYYAARLYGEMKEFAKSRALYEKLLALKPTFELALLDIGTLSEIEGKLDMAVEYYTQALRINPDNKKARARIAAIYVQKKDYDSAISEFEQLSDLDRQDLSIRENIGLLLIEKGKYDEAIREFSFILASRPTDDKTRFYLAMAWKEKGETRRAITELLKIKPGSQEFKVAARTLPSLYIQTNSIDEGIVDLEKLIAENRSAIDFYLVLSGLYEEKADYSRGISVLRTARELEPTNVDVLYQLGMLIEKSGNNAEAVTLMEQLLLVKPEHPGALNFIGYTYAEKGIELDKAEQFIKKALEARPDDGYILDSLAWVLYKKGAYDKALAEILKAQENVSDDPTIAEHLSDIYEKLGRRKEAIESLRKSLDLEKKEERRSILQDKLKGLEKSQ